MCHTKTSITIEILQSLIKKINLIRIILFHKIDYLFGSAERDVPFVFAVLEIHYCVEKVGIFMKAIILLSIKEDWQSQLFYYHAFGNQAIQRILS